MFLPPGVNDVSSWLQWIQIVSDPGAYQKKIEELIEVSNTSRSNFEENKALLMELEKKTKTLESDKTKFNNWSEKEKERIQKTLDDLHIRATNITNREESFKERTSGLEESLSNREKTVSSRESIVSMKEKEIESNLEKSRQMRSELENKLSRLRTIKDLIDNA